MLMTFTLGLASIFAFHGTLKLSDEVEVNLPKTATGEVIVVLPKCKFEIPNGNARRYPFGHSSEMLTNCIEKP